MKSCDDVWPRVDRKRSCAMIFGQGWIARWLTVNRAKIIDQGWIARWSRVDRAKIIDQGWIAGWSKADPVKMIGELQKGKSVINN